MLRKKLMFFITVGLMLMLSLGVAFAAENSGVKVTLDGEPLVFEDQTPVNVDGTVYVPFRALLEAYGQKVTWDQSIKSATAVDTVTEAEVIIRQDNFYVTVSYGGVIYDVMISPQPQIMNGRLMIPTRAISGIFDKNVDWDQQTQTVIVESIKEGTVLKSGEENKLTVGDYFIIENSEEQSAWVAEVEGPYYGPVYKPIGQNGNQMVCKAIRPGEVKMTNAVGGQEFVCVVSEPENTVHGNPYMPAIYKQGDYLRIAMDMREGHDWKATADNPSVKLVSRYDGVNEDGGVQEVFLYYVSGEAAGFTMTFSQAAYMVDTILDNAAFMFTTKEMPAEVSKIAADVTALAEKYAAELGTSFGDKHQALMEAGSREAYSDYSELEAAITKVLKDSGAQYVYTVADIDPSDGHWNLIVEGGDEPEEYGGEYEIEGQFLAAMAGTPTAARTAWEEDGTTFWSAFAPIYNSKGEVVAILGIDYPAPEIIKSYPEWDRDNDLATGDIYNL